MKSYRILSQIGVSLYFLIYIYFFLKIEVFTGRDISHSAEVFKTMTSSIATLLIALVGLTAGVRMLDSYLQFKINKRPKSDR